MEVHANNGSQEKWVGTSRKYVVVLAERTDYSEVIDGMRWYNNEVCETWCRRMK